MFLIKLIVTFLAPACLTGPKGDFLPEYLSRTNVIEKRYKTKRLLIKQGLFVSVSLI